MMYAASVFSRCGLWRFYLAPVCEKVRVRLLQMITGRNMLRVMLIGLAAACLPFASDKSTARALESSGASLQEQGNGLMKNVEEMVAHGGMGDAKAIVHHCGEATRIAETLITHLSQSDPRPVNALTHLNEVIRQCNRVSDIGIHADPGLLLNPATKARAAARESMKSLGLTKTNPG
jgi:hypothetical protein